MKRWTAAMGMGLCLALTIAVADEPAPIRVGVLVGIASDALVTTLNEEEGVKAFLIPRPNPGMFTECDVLIVTQQRIAALLSRQIPAIANWTHGGGGVLLLHDAVGYRQHVPIFPRIGAGSGHPLLNKATIAIAHPVTRGLDVGDVFTHGFQHDHISITTGDDGVAVVTNEEGDPVVVVGKAGEGRAVLNGMLTGAWGEQDMDWGEEREGYPRDAERTLLINAVRWLAGQAE